MWNSEYESNYLAHHGILGQKWGVRRFQNEDGTRTAAGKVRYNGTFGDMKRYAKEKGMDTSTIRGSRKVRKAYRNDYGDKKIEDAQRAKSSAKTRLGRLAADVSETYLIANYKLSGRQIVSSVMKGQIAASPIKSATSIAAIGIGLKAIMSDDPKWSKVGKLVGAAGGALAASTLYNTTAKNVREYAEKNRSKS